MTSASLPSPSSARPWTHDVFLSFHHDTRKGFTSELYRRLKKNQIETFMAHPSVQVGEIYSRTLVEEIKGSRFAIIILSPNYASSTLCLQELKAIYQCMEEKARILPLFFDLNYLQTCFEAAFTDYEKSRIYNLEMLGEWRTVLTAVANLSGSDLKDHETERELVNKIVKDIKTKLSNNPKKNTFFGWGNNVNPSKQDDLAESENRDNKNYIINVGIHQSQPNRDFIRGDRGGDGGYTNNGGFAGAGGQAKGNSTFTYAGQ